MRLLLIVLLLMSSAVNAATYYVKNGGDDNAAGTSDATAWASLSKVAGYSFSAGDDVYFKCGHTWTGEITVDWAGVNSGNRTIFGAYASDGVFTCGGTTKPSFYGGLTPSSRGNIPSSAWSCLVGIQGTLDYVTIQNIRVLNSSGLGICIGGGTSLNYSEYNIIEDSEVYETTGGSVYAYDYSRYTIFRDNVATRCNWARKYGFNPYGGHSGCFSLVRGSKGLMENNLMTDFYGEAFSMSFYGEYNIIRGNIANTTVGGHAEHFMIYSNGGNYTVIEDNLIVTNNQTLAYAGIGISMELATDSHTDSVGTIVRNNVIMGTQGCFYSEMFTDSITAGKTLNFQFIGNTCLSTAKGIELETDNVSVYVTTGGVKTEIANNIFYGLTSTGCNAIADTDISFHHNAWSVTQAALDNDCEGTGDIYSAAPAFNFAGDFDTFNAANMPLTTDFTPTAVVIAVGDDMDATVLNTANYPLYTEIATPCSTFDTTELGYDYSCTARHATTPDIGAIEVSGAGSPDSPVSIPWYMNVGGGSHTGTYSWVAETYDTHIGAYSGSHSDTIVNAIDNTVQQTWQGATTSLNWAVPIANGSYTVQLFGHEQYWGDEGAGTCNEAGGLRAFKVTLEGDDQTPEVDYCKTAGAINTAVIKSYNVTVSDGYLNIVLSRGTMGTDTKPEVMGIGIIACCAGSGTLTINNAVPSINVVNDYPNVSYINVIETVGASTTATPNTLIVSSFNDASITCGTLAAFNTTTLSYTPNDANTGGCGSVDVTIADVNESDTATITITLVSEKYVTFTVKYGGTAAASITDWCWLAVNSQSQVTSAETIIAGASCNEVTDGSGVMTINDSRFVTGTAMKIIVYTPNNHTVGGTNIKNIPFTIHRTARQ